MYFPQWKINLSSLCVSVDQITDVLLYSADKYHKCVLNEEFGWVQRPPHRICEFVWEFFLIFLGFSIIHTSFICSKYIYKSISLFLRSELIEIFCNRDQINANSTFEKEYRVTPLLANNKEKRGLALDGKLKDEDTNLASSTLSVNLHYKSIRLIFMFIVQITALYFYTLQRKTTLLFIKSQINKVTHLHLSLSAVCSPTWISKYKESLSPTKLRLPW